MSLTATAYYYPQMDAVEVVWALILPGSPDPVEPIEVKTAKASLYKGVALQQETDNLTKFFGNDDFFFRALFLHPAATNGLEVVVQVVQRDGTDWNKRIPVMRGEVSAVENDLASNAVNKVNV